MIRVFDVLSTTISPLLDLALFIADSISFVMSANFHTGAEVLNYPWDTKPDLSADDNWWQYVTRQWADTTHTFGPAGYLTALNDGITNGYAWYTINGGRQDYMNYFQHCREMTLELSDVQMIPPSYLLPHWNYNRESFLLYMEECLYGIRGIVTDQSGNPLDCVITVEDHDFNNSEIVTDQVTGNYHRMIFPGVYDLTFSAIGYEPVAIQNIEVTDNEITEVNVVLTSSHYSAEYISKSVFKFSHYPNPFIISELRSVSNIQLELQETQNVDISLYNSKGQKIRTITHNNFQPGVYNFVWDGKNINSKYVSSGIYLYKLKTSEKTEIKKIIFIN